MEASMIDSLWLSIFDLLLVVALLWLAWHLLRSEDLFKAVVLFIAFGLLVALAWARLQAPDVALAEAAVGSGITGALLLSAVRYLEYEVHFPSKLSKRPKKQPEKNRMKKESVWLNTEVLFCFVAGFVFVSGYAIVTLPENSAGLSEIVTSSLHPDGVNNAVTAVLLDFRGYDTFFEIIVLFLAVCGAMSLGPIFSPLQPLADSKVMDVLVRLLAPVSVLVAAYLLWQGGHAPGGAFQAGSILAATMILLMLGKVFKPFQVPVSLRRFLMVIGTIVFAFVAVAVMAWGNSFFQYPPDYVNRLLLLIECCLSVSIMAILGTLFSCCQVEFDPTTHASDRERGD